MKFVIDKNIPFVEKAFNSLGEVILINTGEFVNKVVKDADVLIVRSETKVDKSLLEGSSVKFVGTATIGTDHIDLDYLISKEIKFASAPGSNSNSVKEYVVSALLFLSNVKGFSLKDKTIGVVGVGNVGNKVVKVAEALGMKVLQNDPPRARAENNSVFLPLDELMDADIITLHVPLTKKGEDATYHFFDEKRISKMKQGAILINTARGAVVDSNALKKAILNNHLSATVIDVWENEPSIDVELLKLATIATPHIAGYSLEGKTNAVQMIRDAVCKHFRIESHWDPFEEIGEPELKDIYIENNVNNKEFLLYMIVKKCYDIYYDHQNMIRMLDLLQSERADYFKSLRTGYRARREFTNVTVHLPNGLSSLKDTIQNFGFKCEINNKGKV